MLQIFERAREIQSDFEVEVIPLLNAALLADVSGNSSRWRDQERDKLLSPHCDDESILEITRENEDQLKSRSNSTPKADLQVEEPRNLVTFSNQEREGSLSPKRDDEDRRFLYI